jgi:tetratricopeptide (TPR) repeat protein
MSARKCFGAALALALMAAGPLRAQEQPNELARLPEVEEALNSALQLIGEQRYNEAIAELDAAILADSTYEKLFLAKGDALLALEDYDGSATAYTRALEIDANEPAAYNGRGECYMELSPPIYELALKDFRTALELDRNNAKTLSNIGHVLVSGPANDPVQALQFLDDALAQNDQDARAYRDRGLAHALLRDYKRAVPDLEKAILTAPEDFENYYALAQVQQIQENYAEMADALGKAIETYKPKKRTDPESFIMGYIFRADARLRMAEKETDAAARRAALEGAVADANAVLATYEDRYPESGQALFRRGRAERLLEQYSNAVDSFTKSVQGIPPGQDAAYASEAFLFRGICFFYIGSLELARGDFQQASATGNGFGDPRVYLWIGFTYHQRGDYRLAIDAYNEAIAKSPNFAIAHINKGRAYMDLSEYDRAVECFGNAIRSEPDVGENYYYVGKAYLEQEDFQQAKEFLNLALLKDNPQPKMFQAMAAALRGLGRDDLAEEYERRAGQAPAPETNQTGESERTGLQRRTDAVSTR